MIRKMKKTGDAFTFTNKIKLVKGGRPYFDILLSMIGNAKDTIHLQTYIFSNDETGQLVATALKQAAARNVKVFLMTDGYASQSLHNDFITDLKSYGIHFRFFEPIFKSRNFYFGRRMHHKVLVVDSLYALVGGINISNRYNDMPGAPAWLDFALYAEGEIVQQLCVLCWKSWKSYPKKMRLTPCEKHPPHFFIPKEHCSQVRMRRNDWVRQKFEIAATYIDMFRNAKSEITILSSYFLPGKIIRKELAIAAARGVHVRVIAAGSSDVLLSKYAERWLYDWLLRKGVRLFEFQKNVLHGKLAVCDDEWMTIGSFNINNISTYASIELNLDVKDATFTKHTRLLLDDIINNDCIEITRERHLKTKNIFKQFARWLSYQFIRMLFYVFTFYFKQGV